jgi:hypothetical protein
MGILEGHKESIVRKPESVVPAEGGKFRRIPVAASGKGLSKEVPPGMIQKSVVHRSRIFRNLAPALFFCQKALPDQLIQIDIIWVSRKGGKGLIGRVPVACGAQGKDLPEALAGFLQIVNKILCFPGKASDPVFPGKAEYRKQYAALSHIYLNS